MISAAELQAFIDGTYRDAGYPPDAEKAILPKQFGALFTALSLTVPQTQVIPISANGDFFCTGLRYRAVNAGIAQTVSTVPLVNARMLISDTGTDEQWSNIPIDINAQAQIAGGPAQDMDFPFPRLIAGRSSVSVTLTSFEAAATPTIDFELIGVLVKMYGRIRPMQQATR